MPCSYEISSYFCQSFAAFLRSFFFVGFPFILYHFVWFTFLHSRSTLAGYWAYHASHLSSSLSLLLTSGWFASFDRCVVHFTPYLCRIVEFESRYLPPYNNCICICTIIMLYIRRQRNIEREKTKITQHWKQTRKMLAISSTRKRDGKTLVKIYGTSAHAYVAVHTTHYICSFLPSLLQAAYSWLQAACKQRLDRYIHMLLSISIQFTF